MSSPGFDSYSVDPASAEAPPEAPVTLSVWERAARVFVQPMQAWEGLDRGTRWWFPVLLTLLVQAGLLLGTYDHVLLPTMQAGWERSVESGRVQPAQLEPIERFFSSNAGRAVLAGQQAVVLPIVFVLIAAIAWFGVGFVLGARFPFRLALGVVTWAALVRIPETILTFAIGWVNESLEGIHFGLGALLPPEEVPTKLHAALAVLLDSVGPFNLWYLFLVIVGCSALTGAPRKNIAWVLTALYLALTGVFALVAGVFGSGA